MNESSRNSSYFMSGNGNSIIFFVNFQLKHFIQVSWFDRGTQSNSILWTIAGTKSLFSWTSNTLFKVQEFPTERDWSSFSSTTDTNGTTSQGLSRKAGPRMARGPWCTDLEIHTMAAFHIGLCHMAKELTGTDLTTDLTNIKNQNHYSRLLNRRPAVIRRPAVKKSWNLIADPQIYVVLCTT